MRCEQMHELISPYLDEMTSKKETELIEAHLRECPACQQHLAEMKRMCTLLGQLEAPQVPERFALDLHKRLADEKVKIFAPREIMTPKKSGWLVAGIAGIALGFGMLASSFMPMGAMVALQDLFSPDQEKPAVIDNNKILDEFHKKQGGTQIAVNLPANLGTKTNTETTANKELGQPVSEAGTGNDSVAVNTEVKERVIDSYSTKANVASLDSAMNSIQQIAEANDAQYSVQKPNRVVTAAAATVTRIVELQVPKENVDQVLKELAALGFGTAVKDTADYTEAYMETEKTLAEIGQDIKQLECKASLTAEQEKQLQQLQAQQNDLLAEKQRIDKDYNFATIQIRLVTEINP